MTLTKEERIEAGKAKHDLHVIHLVNAPEFEPWPKISRLNRDILITEKIDGTNACVVVTEEGEVFAQSRTRMLSPYEDNFGFATWVENNKDYLKLLGKGRHYGEWWGQGIQRGYGLTEKRFSLFNVGRWLLVEEQLQTLNAVKELVPQLGTVPILYQGPWFNEGDLTDDVILSKGYFAINDEILRLKREGSQAVPGYMNPEGIVVFHKASGFLFKVTCENDGEYKGKAQNVTNDRPESASTENSERVT